MIGGDDGVKNWACDDEDPYNKIGAPKRSCSTHGVKKKRRDFGEKGKEGKEKGIYAIFQMIT